MKRIAFLCLLLLCGPLRAELKIEGAARAAAGKMVRLHVTGQQPKAGVIWRFDKRRLDGERLGDRLLLTGPPGEYAVEALAITLDKDGRTVIEEAEVTVTIGDAPPPGPGPGPGPPAPADPLALALRAAFDADAGDPRVKVSHAQALAALYRQAPKVLDDAAVATAGELLRTLRVAAARMVPADALPGTRKRIAAELLAVMPDDPAAALTPALKDAARKVFARLADCLGGISL